MWLLLRQALLVQEALKHPLNFWVKELPLKDTDSGLHLVSEQTHTSLFQERGEQLTIFW